MSRSSTPYLILLCGLAATVAVYLPQVNGYWLGDDFNKVESSYRWVQQGSWGELLRQQFLHEFGGNFYRPLTVISLRLTYLLAGSHYAGWFVPDLLFHLLNGLLVFAVVRRLLAMENPTDSGNWVPAYAATAFLLCPFLAEGVFWLCAPDRWVTFFTLLGAYLWIGKSPGALPAQSPTIAWALPVAFLTALLFKESAAVLPLQIALLWLAAPDLREKHRSMALLACFALMGLFFSWRTYLFGDPFTIYAWSTGSEESFRLTKLLSDLTTLGPWLKGLMGEHYIAAVGVVGLLGLLMTGGIAWRWKHGENIRLSLAVGCAAGGLMLATLLNLGGLAGNGEGGRLVYSPLAWFFIALGVAVGGQHNAMAAQPTRLAAIGVMVLPLLLGTWLLFELVSRVSSTQSTMRDLVEAMPELLERQAGSGKGLLLIPDTVGPVIAFRNSQSELMSPPLLQRNRLDEMVPSLLQHLPHNRASFRPAWVACWIADEQQMRVIWTASEAPMSPDDWAELIRKTAQENSCWPV